MTKTIDYDEIEDILFIHEGFKPDEKFKGNIDLGNIIFDLSTNGRIVGVEIINASEFFKEFKLSVKDLKNIEQASIKSLVKKDSLIVFLALKTNKAETRIPIAAPLAVPA